MGFRKLIERQASIQVILQATGGTLVTGSRQIADHLRSQLERPTRFPPGVWPFFGARLK